MHATSHFVAPAQSTPPDLHASTASHSTLHGIPDGHTTPSWPFWSITHVPLLHVPFAAPHATSSHCDGGESITASTLTMLPSVAPSVDPSTGLASLLSSVGSPPSPPAAGRGRKLQPI